MGSTAESALRPVMPPDPGQPPGFPFRGPGLLARVVPFAVVAVLAEASLALPVGVQSQPAMIASIVLLLAVAGSFALPWHRLPAWTTVLVPLAYTGSVLALILAAGETAGVGLVILVPLVWTALFHQRWESACLVVAVVAVEVVTSLVPTAAADSVIARRVLLFAGLGTMISVATHGLRDRIAHSQRESARLQEQLREVTVQQDRDRIAAGLQDEVIQRIFAAGLGLQSAASLTTQPGVRQRVEAAAGDLDQVLRLLREHGLRPGPAVERPRAAPGNPGIVREPVPGTGGQLQRPARRRPAPRHRNLAYQAAARSPRRDRAGRRPRQHRRQ